MPEQQKIVYRCFWSLLNPLFMFQMLVIRVPSSNFCRSNFYPARMISFLKHITLGQRLWTNYYWVLVTKVLSWQEELIGSVDKSRNSFCIIICKRRAQDHICIFILKVVQLLSLFAKDYYVIRMVLAKRQNQGSMEQKTQNKFKKTQLLFIDKETKYWKRLNH